MVKSPSTWYFEQGPRWRRRRVNGPEDAVVMEMIKHLPQEKVYEITVCLQARVCGSGRGSQLLKEPAIGISAEARC